MTSHEKASNRTLMGKCFCGAVHYAVPDEFLYAMNCHCSTAGGPLVRPSSRSAESSATSSASPRAKTVYWSTATRTATTPIVRRAVRSCIRWSATESSFTSPWELSSMIRLSARPDISSSVPRHRGSQSPTTCPNMRRYPLESRDAWRAAFVADSCRSVSLPEIAGRGPERLSRVETRHSRFGRNLMPKL